MLRSVVQKSFRARAGGGLLRISAGQNRIATCRNPQPWIAPTPRSTSRWMTLQNLYHQIEISDTEAKWQTSWPHKLKPWDMNVLTPSGFWKQTSYVALYFSHGVFLSCGSTFASLSTSVPSASMQFKSSCGVRGMTTYSTYSISSLALDCNATPPHLTNASTSFVTLTLVMCALVCIT